MVERLASRSLTGRGLGIRVHQHFGLRLHFLRNGDVTYYDIALGDARGLSIRHQQGINACTFRNRVLNEFSSLIAI
jgi:hypothetical protein